MKYNLVSNDENSANITVFYDGEMYVANNEHPRWVDIVAGVVQGDVSVLSLFDLSEAVSQQLILQDLSERVSVANGRVYFDGDEVDSALTRQILRFLDEGIEHWVPLVEFYEKIASNPNPHSRENLYRWLTDRDFTITDNGDFVAYKGVVVKDGKYVSVRQGTAFVDGELITGNIPNEIGSVITMPRSEVQFDSTVGCSTGLHAGTWEYAKDFADKVLEVHINPRDVVSVPTDSNDQKLRVCRYEVVNVVDAPRAQVVAFCHLPEDEYFDDEIYDPRDQVDPWRTNYPY